ncbi:hypothetical protein [Methylocystis sp.]|uniref:hypothetical protein n=1 Tax=Methylocystis sp. TaxID=1911079 RepID=UPI003DA3F69F
MRDQLRATEREVIERAKRRRLQHHEIEPHSAGQNDRTFEALGKKMKPRKALL